MDGTNRWERIHRKLVGWESSGQKSFGQDSVGWKPNVWDSVRPNHPLRRANCWNQSVLIAAVVSWLVLSITASAVGQSFRVHTKLISNEQSKPVAESLTIADGGFVFDFAYSPENPTVPREIVMLDLRRQQFVLMDVTRQVKVQVAETEIQQMLADLRTQLLSDPELKGLVDGFTPEVTDVASGQVRLQAERFEYLATCEKPKNPGVLPAYFDYLDHFARLNVTDPTRMAPFARLKLNTAIKSYGWVPTKIELVLKRPNRFKKNQTLTSTHDIVWTLSKDDMRLLDEAKKQLVEFESVNLAQYRQWKTQTGAAANDTTKAGN
jgi:hypothetical protein